MNFKKIAVVCVAALLFIFKSYGQYLDTEILIVSSNIYKSESLNLNWIIGGDKHITTLSSMGTSVAEKQHVNYTVYPNPASHYVILHANPFVETLSYNVYDIQGAIILSGMVLSELEIIDFQKYSNGLYFLNVLNNQGESISTTKIQIIK